MSEFIYQGLKISYFDSGYGMPLFFQHGLGNYKEQVYPLLTGLTGLRIISFDCPGHGRSSPADVSMYSFSGYGEVLFALMEHLGLKTAALGGISMGAALAVHCAARRPDLCIKLLLIRPAWCCGPIQADRREIYKQIATFLLMDNGEEEYRRSALYQRLFQRQPEAADSFIPFFHASLAKETAEKFISLPADSSAEAEDLQLLKDIPTMILSMKEDFFHPAAVAEDLYARLPYARREELPSKYRSEEQYRTALRFYVADFCKDVVSD